MDLLVQAVLLNVAAHMTASALGGATIVTRVGRPAWQGATLGALLPWLGLVILAARTARRPRVWQRGPARRGLGLVGVLFLVLGGAAALGSLPGEWVRVSGSALQVRESVRFIGLQSGALTTGAVVVTAVFVGLALGSWTFGGLRFSLVSAFLTTVAATTFVNVMIVARLLAQLAKQSENVAAGTVRVSLLIGQGGWIALGGCVVAYIGSLLLVAAKPSAKATPTSAVSAVVSASAIPAYPTTQLPPSAVQTDGWNGLVTPHSTAWGQPAASPHSRPAGHLAANGWPPADTTDGW